MLGIFIDIETTGLDSKKHRCLEIALRIIDLNSGEERAAYQSIVKQSKAVWEKSDQESLRINGFKWTDLENGKSEEQINKEIIDLFTKLSISNQSAVFIGQNPSFDRGFFSQIIDVYDQHTRNWPYHWLDFASMYWGIQVKEKTTQLKQINFSKNAIAKQYNLATEEHPHRAMNGVDHLILCYRHVVGYSQ